MDDESEILDSTNEELENADSQNGDTDSGFDNLDDVDDVSTLREKNAQLFARAKRAEGFVLKDGSWVKKPKVTAEQPKPKDLTPLDDDRVAAVLDKRELAELDLDDEIKKEVQDYAKLKGISIKKALSSDYIVFRKGEAEKKARVEDAALGSKGRAPSKRNYEEMTPSDFDLKTPEGQADFVKFEDHMRKQLG